MSLAIATPALAQDENLNKEIVVEKDYTPIEQKASKLALMPSVVKFEPAASNLTFSMQNSPIATGNEISTLPAYGYLTKYIDSDPRGYVNFSMGSYLNINASAGFKIVDTKKSKLAVFANHLSTGGVKNDLIYSCYGPNSYFPDLDNLKFKQKWNNEKVGINFTQTVGNCLFYTNATYNYSHVRINKYFWTEDKDYYSYTGSNDVDFNIGVKQINEAPLNYYANVNTNYFDYKYHAYLPLKNRQTFVKFNGGISQRVNEKYEAGLKLDGSFMHTNLEMGDTVLYTHEPVGYITPKTHTSDIGLIRLTPYYAKREGKLKYSLGVNLDMRINDDKFLKVSPEVKAVFNIVKWLDIFGTATGGTYFNRLYDMTMENPYSMPYNEYYLGKKFSNSSFSQVDAKVGLAVGPFKGFRMKIYYGYANTKDVVLPVDSEPYRYSKR
ncbi:MAG: hypothetical protein K2J74_07710, partial [Muribaculaceae bacterium]|nr:hypothetical protein [Muribaculaceae bacterium]